MGYDDMRSVFYFVIYINLGFALLSACGISPIHITIPGSDTDLTADIQNNVDSMQNEFANMDGLFSTLTSSLFIIVKGIYIMLDFIALIFLGIPAILTAVGIDSTIAGIITTVIFAPVIYDFGSKLLRIS